MKSTSTQFSNRLKFKKMPNSPSSKPSIGIIGRGNFSQLLKDLLSPFGREINLIGRDSSLEERQKVMKSDIVILGVTLDAYPKVLSELKNKLRPDSLLVDVCSVKVKPLGLIKEVLPAHTNLLVTHPLFGPQSASSGTKNLKFIVCEQSGDMADMLVEFCRSSLDLDIIQMTPEEHDRAMAYTHALTFFVSQALHPFELDRHGITTPSFNELLDLSNVSKYESQELLASIHNDNPFAKEVREQFIKQSLELSKSLD